MSEEHTVSTIRPEVLCHVVYRLCIHISEEHIASMFRAEVLCHVVFWPCANISEDHWYTATILHGRTTQKIIDTSLWKCYRNVINFYNKCGWSAWNWKVCLPWCINWLCSGSGFCSNHQIEVENWCPDSFNCFFESC